MKKRTIILICLGLLLAFGINYVMFTGMIQGLPPAVEEALEDVEDAYANVNEALDSDNTFVKVTYERNKMTIEPVTKAEVGLVMYGEGKEDVRTYAPIARMLAESGIKVVIMSRRLEMRISEDKLFERIEAVIQEDPALDWYIGGHTSGARTPVKYAKANLDDFEGIVLWAPRLLEDSDISSVSLPVLFVYGTLDDANEDLVNRNKPLVPPQTVWVSIEGANRADFSYWGPMAADVGSTIPIPEIQKQAAEATIAFIQH